MKKNNYFYFDQFHIYCFGLNIYTKDNFDKFVKYATEKYGEERAKMWQENTLCHYKTIDIGNLTFMWLK